MKYSDHDPLKFDPRMFMNSEQRARVMAERDAVEYALYERVEVLGLGIGTIVEVLHDGTFKVELVNGSIHYADKNSMRKTNQLEIGSELSLDSQHEVGSTFERHGHTYRVIHCRYIGSTEASDLNDQDIFVDVGWHTTAVLEK